jgi:hypothetical protein
MRTIVAIGGAVIKTAWPEIKEAASRGMIDVLIHNGGSIFHDFQMATEEKFHNPMGAYYSLDTMLENPELAKPTAKLVWEWLRRGSCPEGTLTKIMTIQAIPPLMFTAPGCDFWHLFRSDGDWELLARFIKQNLAILIGFMRNDFHYICMGSAVIHPEIFKTSLALAKPKNFRADVVDFLPHQYRPETRVARYGEYFTMPHKDFLNGWMTGMFDEIFKEKGKHANR